MSARLWKSTPELFVAYGFEWLQLPHRVDAIFFTHEVFLARAALAITALPDDRPRQSITLMIAILPSPNQLLRAVTHIIKLIWQPHESILLQYVVFYICFFV